MGEAADALCKVEVAAGFGSSNEDIGRGVGEFWAEEDMQQGTSFGPTDLDSVTVWMILVL